MEVAKMRNVLLIAAGLFGGMWVFQIYTAFLPEFFRTYRGMTLSEASLMTQVLPFTGLFAALGGGIGTGMSGLRKPFTWPIAFATLVGCAGAIMLPDPMWIRLSLVLVGIGAAGSLAAITTLLMELPGMNPTRVGAAIGFVWAIGYFGAFISPFLGGALAAQIGLRDRDARLSGLPVPADRDDVLPARNRARPHALRNRRRLRRVVPFVIQSRRAANRSPLPPRERIEGEGPYSARDFSRARFKIPPPRLVLVPLPVFGKGLGVRMHASSAIPLLVPLPPMGRG